MEDSRNYAIANAMLDAARSAGGSVATQLGSSRAWWSLLLVVGLSAGCRVYNDKLVNGATGTPAVDASAGVAPTALADSGVAMMSKVDAGPAFDPSSCTWGECWWSTMPADGACKSAGAPRVSDRPAATGDGATSVEDIYLGFTQVRVGTTNRAGATTDDAWEDFGFDLDGVCTNSSTCPNVSDVSCKSAVAALPFDGQLCRDNTLARLQPVVAKVPEIGKTFGLAETQFNCSLWRGSYNVVIKLSGYNGLANDSEVRADFYQSNGLEKTIPWTCTADNTTFRDDYPAWLSSYPWRISQADLTGPITTPGTLPASTTADPVAYVKNGYLVAHLPDGAQQGFVGDDMPYHGFLFKTHQALFVGNVVKQQDGTWSMRDGLLGGRITKDDFAEAFRQIGFCATGDYQSFYNDMLTYLNQDADVLASGLSDPTQPCDALSYGIGFEAAQLTPGSAVTLPARTECCPPGKTVEECSAVCGDGKVTGDEKCDKAIAAGQPGACPTSCTAGDACSPSTVQGTDCAAVCTPTPITMAGAKDGCCPPGANASTDADCMAKCGNGVVESGETCDPPGSCLACTSSGACFTSKSTGSAATCDLRCTSAPVTQCRGGDQCCPGSCTNSSDKDCSSTCGNGKIDPGETCEKTGNNICPTLAGCNDNNPCTVDTLVGNANNCNAVCSNVAITQTMNGDGCCPTGATANTDSDCKATCGNKIVEAGETCDDGNQVAGDGCADCQTETPAQMCLAKQDKMDACASCTCDKCAAEANACQGAANSGDAKLCNDMVQCARTSGCRDPDCLCGSVDILSCLAGIPGNGPCVNQTIAAAGSNVPATIYTRKSDIKYPLGRANALGACVDMNCSTQCKAGM